MKDVSRLDASRSSDVAARADAGPRGGRESPNLPVDPVFAPNAGTKCVISLTMHQRLLNSTQFRVEFQKSKVGEEAGALHVERVLEGRLGGESESGTSICRASTGGRGQRRFGMCMDVLVR